MRASYFGWELAFTLLDKLVRLAVDFAVECWELAFTLLDKLVLEPGPAARGLGISIHPS